MTKLACNYQEAKESLRSINDIIRWAMTQFNQHDLFYGHGTECSLDDAAALTLSALHLPPDLDSSYFNATLLPSEKEAILSLIKKRIEDRIPVPYLIKETYFAGFSFYIDERVLIPRSPIAELLEEEFSPWIETDHIQRILDLGTGSGCIGIASALFFPEAFVDAVDISDAALDVARVNVERYGLEDQVRLVKSDLFSALDPNSKYDIIIANPPYVPTSSMNELPKEYSHEPTSALDGGTDGLVFVKKILSEAVKYLTSHGILIVEVGEAQDNLEALYPEIPFTWLQFNRGGEGVFLLTCQELIEYQSQLICNN